MSSSCSTTATSRSEIYSRPSSRRESGREFSGVVTWRGRRHGRQQWLRPSVELVDLVEDRLARLDRAFLADVVAVDVDDRHEPGLVNARQRAHRDSDVEVIVIAADEDRLGLGRTGADGVIAPEADGRNEGDDMFLILDRGRGVRCRIGQLVEVGFGMPGVEQAPGCGQSNSDESGDMNEPAYEHEGILHGRAALW